MVTDSKINKCVQRCVNTYHIGWTDSYMANSSFISCVPYVKLDTMCLKNSHLANSLYATPVRKATSSVMEMTNVGKYVR